MSALKLTQDDYDRIAGLLTPRTNKYFLHKPWPKQAAFLLLDQKEAMFGGAAAGGKSDTLLMAALQYVDVPGYAALILRRSFADLNLPGAIMSRAKEWLLIHPEVHWSEKEKTFTFPSGATLTFGYLECAKDKFRYQGSEFQFIGFDELTQFPMSEYTYLFTRLRKTNDIPVPLRMRSATNPGGNFGNWVRDRFILNKDHADVSVRIFIPANVQDNPAVNYEEYKASLDETDEVTRAQMLHGDWDARPEGLVYPEMEDCVFDPETVFNNGLPEGEHFGGIDWGFTSPACFLIGVLDSNQHIWIYYERYTRNKTIPEHADALPKDNDVLWFADPALPESIAQLRRKDFTVRKANNDIKTGVNIVKDWIRKGRLHISSECKSLLEESKLYRRRSGEKKGDKDVGDVEQGDPDIPIKKNDHAMDSCRYMCVGVHKLVGGFRDDETGDDEVQLPENQVITDKRWKPSQLPAGELPTKEEIDEYYDVDAPHWWGNR